MTVIGDSEGIKNEKINTNTCKYSKCERDVTCRFVTVICIRYEKGEAHQNNNNNIENLIANTYK